MGNLFCKRNDSSESSSSSSSSSSSTPAFSTICDKYETLEAVQEALRSAGLESSNLIIGVDYTKSNEWTGKRTFGGICLHSISVRASHLLRNSSQSSQPSFSASSSASAASAASPPPAFEPGAASDSFVDVIKPQASDIVAAQPAQPAQPVQSIAVQPLDYSQLNPYQQAIAIIGQTLSPFDDDNLIPAFGFGCSRTGDKSVFSFMPNHQPCQGFDQVLAKYEELTPSIQLAGPTSFAPLIYKAIETVKETKGYTILLIVADGQVTNEKETVAAIVAASKYPISIVMIGVGDGPWEIMNEFDDRLPQRVFDNFQFVNLTEIMQSNRPNKHVEFAWAALQEIPDQYKLIRKLKYL